MAHGVAAHVWRSLSGSGNGHADADTEERLDHFIDGSSALTAAAIFSTLAIVLSFYEMYMHLKYYNRPLLQRQIIRIILIVPIYALGSLLSLSFPSSSLYFNTVRDIYEAYVIHSFLALMLDFPGGEPAVVAGIADKPRLKHPVPCCCLPRMQLNHRFIQSCKRMTLQFIIIKPVTAVISLILMVAGYYHSNEWQYTLLVVYNISYTTALYGLLLFYLATKHLLKGFHAVGKFAAVKIIVFATYYQSLLVVAIPGMDTLGSSEKWNDFIICIEMFCFAVMHMYCFGHAEFLPGGVGMRNANRDEEDAPVNLKTDTTVMAALSRASDVLSIKDVVADASRVFTSRYTSYIMQGVEGGIVTENRADHLRTGHPASTSGSGGASAAGVGGMVTVQQGHLGTDKEALVASAPDVVVKVRRESGGEDILRTRGLGSQAGSVVPSRHAVAPKVEGAAFSGGFHDDVVGTANPYALIMAVDGVTDATVLGVAVETPTGPNGAPITSRTSMGRTSRAHPPAKPASRQREDTAASADELPPPIGAGIHRDGGADSRTSTPRADSPLHNMGGGATTTASTTSAALLARSAATAAAMVQASLKQRKERGVAAPGGEVEGDAIQHSGSGKVAGGAGVPGPLKPITATPASATARSTSGGKPGSTTSEGGTKDDVVRFAGERARAARGAGSDGDDAASGDDEVGDVKAGGQLQVGGGANESSDMYAAIALSPVHGHGDATSQDGASDAWQPSFEEDAAHAAAYLTSPITAAPVTLSERQRRAQERTGALKLSADRVAAAVPPPSHKPAAPVPATTLSANPETWAFNPTIPTQGEEDGEGSPTPGATHPPPPPAAATPDGGSSNGVAEPPAARTGRTAASGEGLEGGAHSSESPAMSEGEDDGSLAQDVAMRHGRHSSEGVVSWESATVDFKPALTGLRPPPSLPPPAAGSRRAVGRGGSNTGIPTSTTSPVSVGVVTLPTSLPCTTGDEQAGGGHDGSASTPSPHPAPPASPLAHPPPPCSVDAPTDEHEGGGDGGGESVVSAVPTPAPRRMVVKEEEATESNAAVRHVFTPSDSRMHFSPGSTSRRSSLKPVVEDIVDVLAGEVEEQEQSREETAAVATTPVTAAPSAPLVHQPSVSTMPAVRQAMTPSHATITPAAHLGDEWDATATAAAVEVPASTSPPTPTPAPETDAFGGGLDADAWVPVPMPAATTTPAVPTAMDEWGAAGFGVSDAAAPLTAVGDDSGMADLFASEEGVTGDSTPASAGEGYDAEAQAARRMAQHAAHEEEGAASFDAAEAGWA